MTTRTIHLKLSKQPSVLGSYPRVLLTRRPDILSLQEPPEFEVRLDKVLIDPLAVAKLRLSLRVRRV